MAGSRGERLKESLVVAKNASVLMRLYLESHTIFVLYYICCLLKGSTIAKTISNKEQ